MEKQTVFIKRYPSKGELPKFKDGVYQGYFHTEFGLVKYSKYDGWKLARKYPDYFLEEIELPSEEEIDKSGDDFAYPHIDSAFAFNCFMHGANFILNKLKGETK